MAGRPLTRARRAAPSRGRSRLSARSSGCPTRDFRDHYETTMGFIEWEMRQKGAARKAGFAMVETLLDEQAKKLERRGWVLPRGEVVTTSRGGVVLRTICHASMKRSSSVLCMREELE